MVLSFGGILHATFRTLQNAHKILVSMFCFIEIVEFAYFIKFVGQIVFG